jgi:hypothetical protein
MSTDGIYCDAKYQDGQAAIAAVAILYGRVEEVRTDIVDVDSSHAGELAAIALGKSLSAGPLIFNDSVTACAEGNAVWIPRNRNSLAHSAANRAWVEQETESMIGRVAPANRPHRRRTGRSGRGILTQDERNRLTAAGWKL